MPTSSSTDFDINYQEMFRHWYQFVTDEEEKEKEERRIQMAREVMFRERLEELSGRWESDWARVKEQELQELQESFREICKPLLEKTKKDDLLPDDLFEV